MESVFCRIFIFFILFGIATYSKAHSRIDSCVQCTIQLAENECAIGVRFHSDARYETKAVLVRQKIEGVAVRDRLDLDSLRHPAAAGGHNALHHI